MLTKLKERDRSQRAFRWAVDLCVLLAKELEVQPGEPSARPVSRGRGFLVAEKEPYLWRGVRQVCWGAQYWK